MKTSQPSNSPASGNRFLGRVYLLLMALMALTGFGQMPIFKRYYIADIPGLGWLADFYFTHILHYIGAMALLAIFAYFITGFLLQGRKTNRLTASAFTRILLLAGLVATGIFRVFKNLPDVTFSPGFTLFIDIAHLGFMMSFVFAAFIFLVFKKGWLTASR